MIELSVVIPTYNRTAILKKTLESLGRQTADRKCFEVIIIDDGSSQKELIVLKQLVKKQKIKTTLLLQKHQGPAAARNRGIRQAKGKIVLIINDDTVPHRDLIKKHIVFHQSQPGNEIGLLGQVTWHPDIKISKFMEWLENGGPYFDFNSIKGHIAGWQRLWTCNVSLKREFLLTKGLFDEEFPDAAWEDVELGYRLHRSGFVLHYDENALGYHYHPTTIASIGNKMKANGGNLVLIRQKLPQEYWPPLAKHPRLAIFLDRILCLGFLARASQIFSVVFDQFSVGLLSDLILLHYRIVGLKAALYNHSNTST